MRSRFRLRAALVALGLLAAACGGGAPATQAPGSTPAPAQNQTQSQAKPAGGLAHVTFRLSYIFQGYHAPYYLALERGYYKDGGLDVTIEEGRGSAVTGEGVGNGNDTFGEVDTSTAATLIAKGVPIKVVAVLYQKTTMGTVFLPGVSITKPSDLKGMTIGQAPGTGTATVWPVFLKENGIPESQLTMVNMNNNDLPAALMTHKVQAYNTFFTTAVPLLEARGVKGVKTLNWGDFNLDLMGQGWVASLDTIKNHPDWVKAFVQGTVRGWEDAIKDPEAAAAAALKYFPKQSADSIIGSIKLSEPLVSSDNTKGHPFGWQSSTSWQDTLKILKDSGQLKTDVPLDKIYTNAFITGSSGG